MADGLAAKTAVARRTILRDICALRDDFRSDRITDPAPVQTTPFRKRPV